MATISQIFSNLFLNKNCCISIRISLKFVSSGRIKDNWQLIRRADNKPLLSEPMLPQLPTHICFNDLGRDTKFSWKRKIYPPVSLISFIWKLKLIPRGPWYHLVPLCHDVLSLWRPFAPRISLDTMSVNSLLPGRFGNNFRSVIPQLLLRLNSWELVKLFSGKCRRTSLMISQHWSR